MVLVVDLENFTVVHTYLAIFVVDFFILTWRFSLLAWDVFLLSLALFQELPQFCLEPSGSVPSWPFPQPGPEFIDVKYILCPVLFYEINMDAFRFLFFFDFMDVLTLVFVDYQ